MNLLTLISDAAPTWTPEWVSDRGVAWVKALFDIAKVMIDDFGILGLAVLAIMQNLRSKTQELKLQAMQERLDRQGSKIENNAQAITAVALATPPPDSSTPPANPVTVNP